jgi:hypothetical protein
MFKDEFFAFDKYQWNASNDQTKSEDKINIASIHNKTKTLNHFLLCIL